jgi:hypothetical protein
MGRAMSIPWLYEIGAQALCIVQAPFRRGNWLPNLPPPINRWTMTRPLPAFGADFRAWWRQRTLAGRRRQRQSQIGIFALVAGAAAVVVWVLTRKRSG